MIAHVSDSKVDSLSHPFAQRIAATLNADTERGKKWIVIDDEENLVAAANAGVVVERLFLTEGTPSTRTEASALSTLPVSTISVGTAKRLFGGAKRCRVFGLARRPGTRSVQEVLARGGDVLVLDRIALAGNAGAIIRSALAFGVGSLVLVNPAFDLFDRRVIRASRGLLFSLPVATADVGELLTAVHELALPLMLSSAVRGASPASCLNKPERVVLVLGSERTGCDPLLERAATQWITIPTAPAVESLNLSVAAAILLYERSVHRSDQPRKGAETRG